MRRMLFAVLAGLACTGQSPGPLRACEADEATVRRLEAWEHTYRDATLGFEERVAPLWAAIEAEPENVFLHHAYQRVFLNYIESLRIPAAEARYEKLLAARPESLAVRYAYARLLWGRRTSDAKAMLERVIAADGEFPWPHLALARIYENKAFLHVERQREETARFAVLCPGTLATEAYDAYGKMPVEFRVAAGAALRKRVEASPSRGVYGAMGALWQLEFQDVSQDKEVRRARVEADLARLRKAGEASLPLLRIALEGYRLIDDREGARWARERISAVAPQSFPACDIAMQRWYSDRTRPTMEDKRERVQGYYRELLEASGEWVRICPLYEDGWSARLRALRELPDSSAASVLEAGEGSLRASARNSSNSFVAPSLRVAATFAERGIGWERMPELAARNRRDTEARLAADRTLDWFPESWKAENLVEAAEGAVREQLLLVRMYLREKKTAEAGRALAEAERVAEQATGDAAMWATMGPLLDAYLEMGEKGKAEDAVKRLRAWLAAHAPGEQAPRHETITHGMREALVWEAVARMAEREKRTADAAAAYREVLQRRTGWETLVSRFAMIDKAGGRFTAPGGELAGKWDRTERKFTGMALTDLNGRRWTEESLRGKVTLVNLWATWCGPCVAELPYVARIAAAVKDRKEVQVITLNVDENPGLIAPFLRTRGIGPLTVIPAADYVMETLGVRGFPVTWIVDRDGVARREQGGFTAEPAKWVERVLEVLR